MFCSSGDKEKTINEQQQNFTEGSSCKMQHLRVFVFIYLFKVQLVCSMVSS